MSTVLSNLLVIIAIVVSAGYAAWRLGPRKMRDAVRTRLRTALPSVFGNLNDSSSAGACDAWWWLRADNEDRGACGWQRTRGFLAQTRALRL